MTRRAIQWVAFSVCIVTLVIQITSLETGILEDFKDLILPVGFGIGILLLVVSFLLKRDRNYN